MVQKVTSYNAASGGTPVNQVEHVYNPFAQIKESWQSHSGAVGGSTLKVQYAYANGSANTIRRTSCTYPNGRQIDYNFATSGSIDDSLSRVKSIREGANSRVIYTYLGTSFVTTTERPDSSLRSELRGGSGYSGLDRFDRVIDFRWFDYSTGTPGTIVDQIKHGYDKNSNRLWRENVKARDASEEFDWLYAYDSLDRLASGEMGTLNSGHTALTSAVFGQEWGLDATGNWQTFKEGDGTTWDLEQERESNKVNEITDMTNTVGSAWAEPAYDDVGNMTTVPKPAAINTAFTATYDAWNRLVKLEDGSGIVAEYGYDGLNRRTVKKTNYTGSTPGTVRHFYYSEQWQVLEERVDGRTNPVERQFLWGLQYIDDLVFRDRDTADDGTLEERLYAIRDPNWNVTTLWGKNSGGTAWEIKERFEYAPYGESGVFDAAFSPSTDAFDWETKYAGYRRDGESALYAVRFRMYHPILGVWTSRDPIEYFAEDLNLYRYVGNCPVKLQDSLGLIIPLLIAIGAAGTGTGAAATTTVVTTMSASAFVNSGLAIVVVAVGTTAAYIFGSGDSDTSSDTGGSAPYYPGLDPKSCIRGPSTRPEPIKLPPLVPDIDTEPNPSPSVPKPAPVPGDDLSPEEKKALEDWLKDCPKQTEVKQKDDCSAKLEECLKNPWQPPERREQWGPKKDCLACYFECDEDGQWPTYKCP